MNTSNFQPPEGFEPDDWWDERGSRRASSRRRLPAKLREPVPFESLPRSKRRDAAASMSWRIQSDPNGRGVFTSHVVLPGSREWPVDPDQPVGIVHWADLFFMSKKPLRHGVFYNATITTAAHVASKAIVDHVEAEVFRQIPESEHPLTRLRSFSRRNQDGGVSMVFAPDQGIPSLDGLTVPGARAQWLREHWQDWPKWVKVAEMARFLPGYQSGFGLDLVVGAPNLTVDALADCVGRFWEQGEQEFQGEPLAPEVLAPALEPLLKSHLWRWDASQARAAGEKEPAPPPPDVLAVMNHESNAIRL